MGDRFLFAFLAAAALGAGCGAVNGTFLGRIAEESRGLEPAVEDDEAVVRAAMRAAGAGAPPPSEEPMPESSGLENYVEIALRDNPTIRRSVRQLQSLGYRIPQVASLDDPMINLIPPTGDMTETAAGMMGGAISVSQKIPFPGKLTTRGRITEQAARMAVGTLADARISTVADVQRAYYAYYLAGVSIGITRESERLLRHIRDVAGARYRSGRATQQDVLRAEVELYGLTNQLITLEQQRATAQAQLNSLMNRRVDLPLPEPKAFDLAEVDWKLPQAMERAAASNPRLARLQAQIERDLEAIKLAKLDYFPDLTAGFTYTVIDAEGLSPVATGGDVWNLAFGLNVPIWWQRLRARVLEGNAQVLASVEEYADLRNLLFFQLQDTLVKIDTQYRQAVLLRELIVPRARQTVEVSTSAYQSGALELEPLVQNWRRWLDHSLEYHRALAGIEQRFADLQQLVGMQLPRIPDDGAASDAAVAESPEPNGSEER